MHNKYITKIVFEFFFLLARRKIGLLPNFYFPKETLILGRGKIRELSYSNVKNYFWGKKILFWARRKIELPNFCPKETLLLGGGGNWAATWV
jgi:hypothetical protein